MPLSNFSTISDQFMGTVVNSSSMLYILSMMTLTGRRVYGKYGQMRPTQQETGLEDVSKVVSLVANSKTIHDALAFYTTHDYNIKNIFKIAEMSTFKIIPENGERSPKLAAYYTCVERSPSCRDLLR